jgi:hypothetical protein
MAVRAAVDAWAVQDAGRSDAILEMHREVVRDYPSAAAEPGPLLLPERSDAVKPCWAPQPQDAWRKAA